MRSLLIDVENSEVKEIDITDFRDFYDYLNCEFFDVAHRFVGEQKMRFDIYVDDIGMLKDYPIASAYDNNFSPMLVGNLVITKTDARGEQISLTDDEITYLRNHIKIVYNWNGHDFVKNPALINVQYS